MILECHYDTNPNDQYWEVQYYWTGPVTQSLWLGMPMLVDAAQISLQRANQTRVRHPFRDYGSARTECPSLRDEKLPVKEILPSSAAGTPPAARRSAPVTPPSVAPAPTWVSDHWEYSLVPDNFAPPLRADRRGLIVVRMTRSKPGLLSYVVLDSLGFSPLGKPPGFDDWGDFPQDFKALNEDFKAIQDESGSPSWKGSPAVDGFVHTVITCGYQESRVYYFWYKVRPAAADPVRLRARMSDHPMLKVGRPLDACPVSETEASGNASAPVR
jgi:hypothetical protein